MIHIVQHFNLNSSRGYGDSVNKMIKDHLVCCTKHKGIQCRLLAEKDLTFNKAFNWHRDIRNFKNTFLEFDYSTDKVRDHREKKGTCISCCHCGGPHLAQRVIWPKPAEHTCISENYYYYYYYHYILLIIIIIIINLSITKNIEL